MQATVVPEERERFVERVAQALVVSGGRLLIVGEYGIGKTSLVNAAIDQAGTASPLRVLYARAARGSAPHPYLGLHDLLADVDLKDVALAPPQELALRTALGQRVAENELSMGVLLVAFDSLVRSLLRKGPVAIVIDDIDEIDAETRELVNFVGSRPRAAASPAMIATRSLSLAVSEPEPHAVLSMFAADQVLHLPPLQSKGLGQVVKANWDAHLSARDMKQLVDLSGGNPMSALELALRATSRQEPRVPTSLSTLIGDRIANASKTSRSVLAVAALMGPCAAHEIESILRAPKGSVSAAIDERLIRETDGRIVPAHALLATEALGSLADGATKDLHARIATVVTDPSDRAHHLDRSVDTGPVEEIAAALASAGAAARRIGAVAVAADYLQRSLARTSALSTDTCARTLALSEVQFVASDFENALVTLSTLSLGDLTVPQLDHALPLLLTAMTAARGELAARSALTAASTAVGADPVRRAVVNAYLAEASDDPEESRRLAEQALSALRASGKAPITQHRALGALVLASLDEGRGLHDTFLSESESLEPKINLLSVNDSAVAQRGLYSYQVGQIAESRTALELVRARALDVGEDLMAGIFSIHLATADLYAGRRPSADRWLEEWDRVNPWPLCPPPSAIFAHGLRLLRDDDEEALLALVALAHGPGSEAHGQLTRLVLTGFNAARHERWEEALAQLAAAQQTAERMGIREPGRRHWLDFSLARTYIALGQLESAQAIASDLTALSNGRRPLLDGVAIRITGLVSAELSQPELAVQQLRRSARILAEEPFTFEHALTLLELARVLQSQRLRVEAAQAIEGAMTLSRASGDVQFSAVVEGVRERADIFAVGSSLSERERAVAMAAAAGHSNREIAQDNFISVRTVETQLSSAYRKLGVRSRSELAALVHQDML